MDFRSRLKDEISYQDIRLKELAEKAGLSLRTLETYVRTKGSMPAVDVAVRIAQVLGVSVEYLVTGNVSNNIDKDFIPEKYVQFRKLLEILGNIPETKQQKMCELTCSIVKMLVDLSNEKCMEVQNFVRFVHQEYIKSESEKKETAV
ncbi:MAG: helix-turn-helix transcriptional regulator [Bacilli bacterium]|nr:helix-turn-helix transcriptional regulator [Bacilli bacterium]